MNSYLFDVLSLSTLLSLSLSSQGMAMGRASSGLAYPDRFFAAAAYVGFGGSPESNSSGVISKFPNDVALLLYGLYQQATIGPCKGPKPSSWNPVESGKWTSWNGLGNMAPTEAMRLFVKLLEEEDPAWYSRTSETVVEPVAEMALEPTLEKENSSELESKVEMDVRVITDARDSEQVLDIRPKENGFVQKIKAVNNVSDVLSDIKVYDQWISPKISGKPPKSRYEHGAAVVEEKMYIFGGNHNGRYLCDIQCLDLKTLTWSRVEPQSETSEALKIILPAPCAGHSLVTWGSKILSVGGHTKDPAETLTVKEFDPRTCSWSQLKTFGKAPLARGGQSASLVGMNLVIFGGQDARRTLLNDLHVLDLETMTWDDMEAGGVPPSPRADHAAAVHADRYVLIFGGGSHAACFNDLHVLDVQSMEWSKPIPQGIVPSPRAGHAGVTVGENWYIVGGGDNKTGASETLVLNMSTLVWSVVTTVQGRMPVASEGLSLVSCSHMGNDILISFGGYNGRYSNEVYALKPSHKSAVNSNLTESLKTESIAELLPLSNAPNPVENAEADITTDHVPKIVETIEDNLTNDHAEHLLEALKSDNEELQAALAREELQRHQLKQDLAEAEARNAELTKELQSVRGQLASEQSRCFKLEVEIAEMRQKVQALGALQKEVELLQRQKAAAEEAAAMAAANAKQRQSSGGVWGWLAGDTSDRASS
ncbi:acyl-CoA-binding domain-containing protein 6-like isoform X2 [Wolffia australiana]